VLQLVLWFVTLWGGSREIVMRASVRVIVCYSLGSGKQMVMFAAVSFRFVTVWGEGGKWCCVL
jgi:hypothetical protein